ncbi:MAG: helix-turn-helix transcriptional regulator [Bacteroidota bacterium]
MGNLQKTIERLSVKNLNKDFRNRIKPLIGWEVRKYREMANIDRYEMAKALGISYQQLQKYETGENRISAITLLSIAVLVDKPIEYFYESSRQFIEE